MTPEHARQRVNVIRESAGDDERAHELEDSLLYDFVTAVAMQEGPHKATAVEILKAREIDFERWCA